MTVITKKKFRIIHGDIFQSKDQTIVNTVNTVGVMGKGIALEFKKRYQNLFKRYKELCDKKEITIGKLFLYKDEYPWVLNFPTKDDWRKKSKSEYIDKGLNFFRQHYKEWGIKSISFSQLGCSNGGLSWSDVRPLMEKCLKDLDIPVTIYI